MWISTDERQPATVGPQQFRVKRRGLRRNPDYEDLCTWNPPAQWRPVGYWTNRTGMRISSVIEWWEEHD